VSDFHSVVGDGLSAAGLEEVLRAVGGERYHNRHPFHHQMTAGMLSRAQMQAWALNRYCYQAVIPRKDAMILARAEDPTFRAAWRKRIEDHDGEDGWSGGIARWLHLATSLGLDASLVKAERLALPATRFAVGAYLAFCTNRSLLEAVASSLTELFSPVIINERVPAMLAQYDYISEDTLIYFKARPVQASRDADFALAYVLRHANRPERQQAAVDALLFKCDVLWAMLDALQHAYGEVGQIPPGAFRPEPRP
jgi:pyrroloquinoline-quinone synthase